MGSHQCETIATFASKCRYPVSKPMMTKLLAVAICLLAGPAWAQVRVQVRTEKPQFLAGEPIFVLVQVQNVGIEQVAYEGASSEPPVELSVRDGGRKVTNGLTACEGGIPHPRAHGVVDHPRMLQPGKSTTFRHLLRGYRLTPGNYELRVSGTVDVAWRPPYPQVNAPPPPTYKRSVTEPVDGAAIDRALPLTIVAASDEELRAAYVPHVAAAAETVTGGHDAVNAILEMAPAFLEPEIRNLVSQRGRQPAFAEAAAEALAEIDTPSSRAELIDWFDRSDNLQVRSFIVRAVATARHPDNLAFLTSLLPGRSTEIDNGIRRDAALGIGMIGGEAAVSALRDAPLSPDPLVAGAVLRALGSTHSKSAIPILLERVDDRKGHVSNDVCRALMTLTHQQWCAGLGLAETQEKWRTWWAANAKDLRVYGPNDCANDSNLPHIWSKLTHSGLQLGFHDDTAVKRYALASRLEMRRRLTIGHYLREHQRVQHQLTDEKLSAVKVAEGAPQRPRDPRGSGRSVPSIAGQLARREDLANANAGAPGLAVRGASAPSTCSTSGGTAARRPCGLAILGGSGARRLW